MSRLDRNKLRQLLLSKRISNPLADQMLSQHLYALLDQLSPQLIGLYWPIRGEFDARSTVTQWCAQQSSVCHMALPCSPTKNAPLQFLAWQPTHEMITDAYHIPIPKDSFQVTPDLLLLPCVGFTHAANGQYYRLGYGAGSYDRTLALHHITCVGLAYEATRLTYFAFEEHDRPVQYMITEAGCQKSSQ